MNWYSKKKGSNPVAGCRVTRSAGTVFVTLVIAGVLPALADDGKIYPGSMGVPISVDDHGRLLEPCYEYGAIGNPSDDTWLDLYLPAIHDAHNIDSSWVRVIDKSYEGDISCQLFSRYRFGCTYSGWFSPRQSSRGSGCNEQLLSAGWVGANSRSHYYFECSIPPRYGDDDKTISYIISYKVRENTP